MWFPSRKMLIKRHSILQKKRCHQHTRLGLDLHLTTLCSSMRSSMHPIVHAIWPRRYCIRWYSVDGCIDLCPCNFISHFDSGKQGLKCYNTVDTQPYYGCCTGQAVLASTSAPSVHKWKILLEQSFTACML